MFFYLEWDKNKIALNLSHAVNICLCDGYIWIDMANPQEMHYKIPKDTPAYDALMIYLKDKQSGDRIAF